MNAVIDPIAMIRPRRKIVGISAVLLPFDGDKQVAWPAFRAHVARTANAGLIPAVNMDTGFVNLIDEKTRLRVLEQTRDVLGGQSFVAGAFVGDRGGDPFQPDKYRRALHEVQQFGGTPIIFQSFGLTSLSKNDLIAAYQTLARECDRFLAFELGPQFATFGRIYDLDTFAELLAIPRCVGAKHSSLNRNLEWQRLQLRDRIRPEFQVLTGNDLAIDMVMFGSDYLLGLSTFAVEHFALRDKYWEQGDGRFFELNDLLQYLGQFAFRPPVPAYKHSAAQFLYLKGQIPSDSPHPMSPRRPDSDRDVLSEIARRCDAWKIE